MLDANFAKLSRFAPVFKGYTLKIIKLQSSYWNNIDKLSYQVCQKLLGHRHFRQACHFQHIHLIFATQLVLLKMKICTEQTRYTIFKELGNML